MTEFYIYPTQKMAKYYFNKYINIYSIKLFALFNENWVYINEKKIQFKNGDVTRFISDHNQVRGYGKARVLCHPQIDIRSVKQASPMFTVESIKQKGLY